MHLKNSFAVILLVLFSACAYRGPVAGDHDKPLNVGGTISGIVRAGSDMPLSGRRVTAINTETGERITGSTAVNGGYTIKVTPGHYRLEVELRAGEVVMAPPDDVHITRSDLDAGRDFVLTVRAPER